MNLDAVFNPLTIAKLDAIERGDGTPDLGDDTPTAQTAKALTLEIRRREAVDPILNYGLDDDGNGRALAAYVHKLAYFVPAMGWRVFNFADGTYIPADAWASEFGRIIGHLRKSAIPAYRENDLRQAAAWAAQSLRARGIAATVSLAAADPRIQAAPDDFDADGYFLNCLGEYFDLRTRESRPTTAADRCSRTTRVKPAERSSELFEAVVKRTFPGDGDADAFQRLIGYAATGLNREQRSAYIHGPTASGKGSVMEPIVYALGTYAAVADAQTFAEGARNDSPRNDVARLAGARLISIGELEGGAYLAESLFKSFVAGDVIAARFLHREFFNFVPVGKLIFSTNFLPRVRHGGGAVFRRMDILPTGPTIPEAERDPTLRDRLKAEAPGILRWIIDGAAAYFRDGLPKTRTMADALNAYIEDEDRIQRFLDDKTYALPGLRTKSGELYAAYKTFVESEGGRAESIQLFSRAIEERGFPRKKDSSIFFIGLGIKS